MESANQEVANQEVANQEELNTEVLIIGNGPSAIALSVFLSGVTPYYDVANRHPNKAIHEHLLAAGDTSLIQQDLFWYMDPNEMPTPGRSVADLYEKLMHPDDESQMPKCIDFRSEPQRAVPHLVIGKGRSGGSWWDVFLGLETLSSVKQLSLPIRGIGDCIGMFREDTEFTRPRAKHVAWYYREYVTEMGLEAHFIENEAVRCFRKSEDGTWLVRTDSRSIRSKFLVLAGGLSIPKTLEFATTEKSPKENIVYSRKELRNKIKELALDKPNLDVQMRIRPRIEQVVVIGGGLTAMDCVHESHSYRLSVVHVFRESVEELRRNFGQIDTLSQRYQKQLGLMTGDITRPWYTPFPDSNVTDIVGYYAEIHRRRGRYRYPFAIMVIAIGSKPDELAQDAMDKYQFSDYKSQEDDSIFVCGALAGDRFVVNSVGGSLRVAQHLYKARFNE